MCRFFHLPLPVTMAVICGLAILGLCFPLVAETDFNVPPGRAPEPQTITMGPDHNLWFTENSGGKIATINGQGTITEFAIPGAQGLCGITTGPDGNLWFTDEFAGFIGHINTSGGSLVIYNLAAGSHPQGIVTGPDHKLWFVDNSVDLLHPEQGFRVGRIDTSGNVSEFPAGINPIVFDPFDYVTGQIMVGSDGNLWFTNANASAVGINFVGKVTTSGNVSIIPTGDAPGAITSGPDENLWVTESGVSGTAHVAQITTGGAETECALTGGGWSGITTGSDGNIWKR